MKFHQVNEPGQEHPGKLAKSKLDETSNFSDRIITAYNGIITAYICTWHKKVKKLL